MSHTHDRDESDGFIELHPDRGSGEVPCESVTHGLNADFSAYPETSYIRCKKCGFVMNKARHPKGWGIGTLINVTAIPRSTSPVFRP